MKIASLAAIPLVAVLGACTTTPTVPLSKPHGVVVPQTGPGADATHAVAIVEINGVSLPGTRTLFPLAPGRHEIVVTPMIVGEATLLPGSRQWVKQAGLPEHHQFERHALVLDVVEGMQYTVAAHATGPTTDDWIPVLVKIEEIKR